MSDERMEAAYALGLKHGRLKALGEVDDLLLGLVAEIRTQGRKSLCFPVIPDPPDWRDIREPGPKERVSRAEINVEGLLWIREQVGRMKR